MTHKISTFLGVIIFVTIALPYSSSAFYENKTLGEEKKSSHIIPINNTLSYLAHIPREDGSRVRSNPVHGVAQPNTNLSRIGTTQRPILSCYFTGWDQWKQPPYKFLSSSVDPFLCTHIIYAFSKISHNWKMDIYEHNAHEQYRELVALRRVNPQLKILLAIGGWTHGGLSFSQMTADSAKRRIFIDDVVNQLIQFEFDGIDLDWEYPGSKERGSKPEDKENFVIFLRELRQALDSAGRTFLLTAAVAAGKDNIVNGYNIPEVTKYVDYLNLLSYDFHGAWDPVTGINSPYSSTESTLSMTWAANYWISHGADPNKMVIGLATYGRSFTLKSQNPFNHSLGAPVKGPGKAGQFTLEPGVLAYYEICKHLQIDNWEKKWDPKSHAPYAYKDDQWFGYENKRSLDKKLDFVKENCFAGVMVWDLALDDHTGINCNQGKYPLISFIKSRIEPTHWSEHCPRVQVTSTEPTFVTTTQSTSASVSTLVTTTSEALTTTSPPTTLTASLTNQPKISPTIRLTRPTLSQSSLDTSATSTPSLELNSRTVNVTSHYTTPKPSSIITTLRSFTTEKKIDGARSTSTLSTTLIPTTTPLKENVTDTLRDIQCEGGRTNIYICTTPGSFANRYFCGNYYECVKQITGEYLQYERSCADPTNTYFDDVSKNCIWKDESSKMSELCPCDKGKDLSVGVTMITKAPQTNANPTLLTDIPSQSCRDISMTTFLCSSAGLFLDRTDCRFYWECVYNAHSNVYYEYRRSCPPGNQVVFDEKIQTCVWDWQSSTYDIQHCPCNILGLETTVKDVNKSTVPVTTSTDIYSKLTFTTAPSVVNYTIADSVMTLPNSAHIQSQDKVLVCYFTSWDQWKTHPYNFTTASVDPFLCTHIIYAFLNLGVNFTIENIEHNTEEQFQELIALKQHNPNLKILAGLGGWNAGAKHFSDMARNSTHRKTFVLQSVEYLLNRSIDGLDLDWEYPGHGGQGGRLIEDKINFPILLKELRDHFDATTQKLSKSKLLLTAAVSAGELNIINGYDVPKISNYLDYILVMTYDMNGWWQPHAGFNSPLHDNKSDFSLSWAMNFWHKEGAPLHKLVVGVPTYGRIFKLRHPNLHKPGDPILGAGPHGPITGESGTLSYYEICNMIKNDSLGWATTFDNHSKVPYSYKNNLWVNYENEKSIVAKAQHLLNHGYAGAMVWDLALDDWTGIACNQGKYPLISLLSSILGIKALSNKLTKTTGNASKAGIIPPNRPSTHELSRDKNDPRILSSDPKLTAHVREYSEELRKILDSHRFNKLSDYILKSRPTKGKDLKLPVNTLKEQYNLDSSLTDTGFVIISKKEVRQLFDLIINIVQREAWIRKGLGNKVGTRKRALSDIDPHSFGNKLVDITNLNMISYLRDNLSIPEEILFNYTSHLSDPTYSPYLLTMLRILSTQMSPTIPDYGRASYETKTLKEKNGGKKQGDQDGSTFHMNDEGESDNDTGDSLGKDSKGAGKVLRLNGSATYFDNDIIGSYDTNHLPNLNLTRKLNVVLGNHSKIFDNTYNQVTVSKNRTTSDDSHSTAANKTGLRIRLLLPTELNEQFYEGKSIDILNIIRNLTITKLDDDSIRDDSPNGSGDTLARLLKKISPGSPHTNETTVPIILSLLINKEDSKDPLDAKRTLLHLSRKVYVGDENRFNLNDDVPNLFANGSTIVTGDRGSITSVDLKSLAPSPPSKTKTGKGQVGSESPDVIYLNLQNYSIVLNLSSILRDIVAKGSKLPDKSRDPILWDTRVRLGQDGIYEGIDHVGKSSNIIRIKDYRMIPENWVEDDNQGSMEENDGGVAVQKTSMDATLIEGVGEIDAKSPMIKLSEIKVKAKKASRREVSLTTKENVSQKFAVDRESLKEESKNLNHETIKAIGELGNLTELSLPPLVFDDNTNKSNAVQKIACQVEAFTCTKSGTFLDRNDCRYYWNCIEDEDNNLVYHGALHIKCPDKRVMDERIGDCVEPWLIPNIKTICRCSKSLTYLTVA